MASSRGERVATGLQRHYQAKANLQDAFPGIAAEWHPTKNLDLTPGSVHPGTPRVVWWRCGVNPKHEWAAQVRSRTRKGGSGCPHCVHKTSIPAPGESIGDLNNESIAYWHPTKNSSLTPFDVTPGSNKRVWWKCPVADDHVWQSTVASFGRGRRCPFCAGKKVADSNRLSTHHPELVREWHPTRNGDLGPGQVTVRSSKRVWWKCPEGDDHEWQVSVANRTTGTGCPYCGGHYEVGTDKHRGPRKTRVSDNNRLSIQHPDLAAQWHPTKNGKLKPSDVLVGTSRKVWWQCPKGDDHVWRTSVVKRVSGQGCPCCLGQKLADSNRLSVQRPDIAAQWHPTKNGDLAPSDVGVGSARRVWWKCPEGDDHEWLTRVVSRTFGEGTGCPCCLGRKLADSNRLSVQRPDIAAQWHPTKNGDLGPNHLKVGSAEKIWWRCPDNPAHEWSATIKSRVELGAGCPACSIGHESMREVRIRHELAALLGFDTDVRKLAPRLTADMACDSLGLIIEYDGAFFHSSKAAKDSDKTARLRELGWRVVRIREAPLEPLDADDLVVSPNGPVKNVVDELLRHLVTRGIVASDAVAGYLASDFLLNEQAAEDYLRTKRRRPSGESALNGPKRPHLA